MKVILELETHHNPTQIGSSVGAKTRRNFNEELDLCMIKEIPTDHLLVAREEKKAAIILWKNQTQP